MNRLAPIVRCICALKKLRVAQKGVVKVFAFLAVGISDPFQMYMEESFQFILHSFNGLGCSEKAPGAQIEIGHCRQSFEMRSGS
jgi:hypothetical protein